MGAPLNPVPQVLRIFIEGLVNSTTSYKWGNVLFAKYTGPAPSNASCDTLAGFIGSSWGTYVAPIVATQVEKTKVSVTDLTSTSSGQGEDLTTVSGTLSGASPPASAAVLISYPAPTRYKGGHPRNYLLAGVDASLANNSQWTTVFATAAQGAWNAFLNDLIGLTVSGTTIATIGTVRYKGKFLPNGGPPHYYLDTPAYSPLDPSACVAQIEVASQRRRIGRRKS